jgi:hypothetical protein
MSLIGSLEDLSLGDILQIISLSQKSGVLLIQSDEGEGRIVFRGGLVRGASVKGGLLDLREVLVGGDFLSAGEYDAAAEEAHSRDVSIEEALAVRTSITPEKLDSLRRESVESAVISMFHWCKGEFSFDVRTEPEAGDPPLFLPTGINAQYLAMEGARFGDEFERDRTEGGDDGESDGETSFASVSAEIDQGSRPLSWPTSSEALTSGAATEALVQATAERLRASDPDEIEGELVAATPLAVRLETESDGGEPIQECDAAGPELLDSELDVSGPEPDLLDSELDVSGLEPELLDTEPEPALLEAVGDDPRETDAALEGASQGPAAPRGPISPAVVVMDPDLIALEWVKRVLGPDLGRIHIFQRSELGLARIRQYLARAELPLVLVSPDSPGDRLSGIRDTFDFVRRLKRQQQRMRVLWLMQEGAQPMDGLGAADGAVTRPSSQQMRARRGQDEEEVEAKAESFRREIEAQLVSELVVDGLPQSPRRDSTQGLRRLKEATAALSDASTRGEVLPLVIRFAAETFSRVAMFMVREDVILGMAESGLHRAGGPEDSGLRELRFPAQECGWFRTVLRQRGPVRLGPSDSGDTWLANQLGRQAPREAYVAPIESGGQVVALLYADNLPEETPLGDSQALEVVLHHAGLALERAVLERALAEIEDDATPSS